MMAKAPSVPAKLLKRVDTTENQGAKEDGEPKGGEGRLPHFPDRAQRLRDRVTPEDVRVRTREGSHRRQGMDDMVGKDRPAGNGTGPPLPSEGKKGKDPGPDPQVPDTDTDGNPMTPADWKRPDVPPNPDATFSKKIPARKSKPKLPRTGLATYANQIR